MLVVWAGLLAAGLSAQQTPQLPVDPQVRTGVLDNGLTYYIRHNELPEKRAEFYIAQKVGSMQEEESQRGLAHFLEHMAFNGTEHFPDKTMLEYLESIGAKFGTNVNAYTSLDETVYMLMNVPVVRTGIIDSCLLVLYDWSSGISLNEQEIDKERGVIHEEWRTRDNAQTRIWEQILPVIFSGSRYGHRLPIGLMEVIDNFPPQVIRDYYHQWYRPDLQGVIVVGDVDVDQIEAKIRTLFSTIPANPVRTERIYHSVPDNKETIVAFAKDKEATHVRTSIDFKHNIFPREMRNTTDYYVKNYIHSVISSMLNTRLSELTQKADPPFLGARASYSPILGITSTKDAFSMTVVSDENRIERGIRAALTELRRMDQHGFTSAEYERAKANVLRSIESAYNERGKQRNGAYVNEYTRAFIDGEPIPGIEVEYEMYNAFVPEIPLEVINRVASSLITDDNIIVTLQGPDKEGIDYPSKDELLALLDEVSRENTEPYIEEVFDGPLVGELPAPGTIVSTETDPIFDATVWTLSNGARVIVKPTQFKDDQILFRAFSPGGTSLIDSEYDNEVVFMNALSGLGGLGSFDAIALGKALAGKNASISSSVGEMSESMSGSSSPKDLETMMQLFYLRFTSIRSDDEAFASWRSRTAISVRNQSADPSYAYRDSLNGALYNYNPRMMNLTVEKVESVDYAKALDLFRARFTGAADFTFVFVGNVDPEVLRPLVERYIASLPAGPTEKPGEPIMLATGKKEVFFDKITASPKVTTMILLSGILEPTLKNSIEMDMLGQILRSRYTETMREEEGGTYGASVQSNISTSKKQSMVAISFGTNIDQYQHLAGIAIEEIEKIAAEGPSEVDFAKVKEYTLKSHAEVRQENSYWMNSIVNYSMYGIDFMTAYADAVQAMTRSDIQEIARIVLQQGNRIDVTMNGVTAE
jgi:zinc protease